VRLGTQLVAKLETSQKSGNCGPSEPAPESRQ